MSRDPESIELRIVKWAWWVLIGSLAPYVMVVHLVAPVPMPGSQGDQLVMPLAVVAAVIMITATLLRNGLLRRAAGAASKHQVLNVYRAACIASWAMIEGIAVLGVVLAFTGASRFVFYSYMGLALAGMLYFRPSHAELDRLTPTH